MEKFKFITILLTLLCYVNIYGQQSVSSSTQDNLKQTIDTQQETIKQLQVQNEAIRVQLEKMEKEIELYRGDVRNKISELDSEQSRWTTYLCVIIAVVSAFLGVVCPYFINKTFDNKIEAKINTAEAKAEESSKNAQQYAINSKVSELIAQGNAERVNSKAIELYTEAIKLNPKNAVAYNNRGYRKYLIKKYEEAMEDYKEAIKLDSNLSLVYNNRGVVLFEQGDKEGALKDYKEALDLDYNNILARYNRGVYYHSIGEHSEALQDYDKTIEKDPTFYLAYVRRGILNKEEGNLEKAIDDLTNALKIIVGQPIIFEQRALCYRIKAENEQDPKKKNDLIARALADERIL